MVYRNSTLHFCAVTHNRTIANLRLDESFNLQGSTMLTLSEKLLLLSLHDEKGKAVASTIIALPYGLSGALLLDLYLSGHIEFVDKQVKVIRSDAISHPVHKQVLALLSSSDRLRDAKYWLNNIHSKVNKIDNRIAEQLVQKGILSKQEHSFLWLINYNRYPTRDEQPEQDIRSHIKKVVLGGIAASEEDIALLSLVQACELSNEVFDKNERKEATKRIEELVEGQKIGNAIKQIVQDIQAALVVLNTTTAVTTTVVS